MIITVNFDWLIWKSCGKLYRDDNFHDQLITMEMENIDWKYFSTRNNFYNTMQTYCLI